MIFIIILVKLKTTSEMNIKAIGETFKNQMYE